MIKKNNNEVSELASFLITDLTNKVRISYVNKKGYIEGEYFSPYKSNKVRGLPFSIKYEKDSFLRIQISDGREKLTPLGEKLAALSDLYETLKQIFGEPTVYYTAVDDPENRVSLHWGFARSKEDIQKLKDNSFFEDTYVKKLIVMGEPQPEYIPNKKLNRYLGENVGLPKEMIPEIDLDIINYLKYKKGIGLQTHFTQTTDVFREDYDEQITSEDEEKIAQIRSYIEAPIPDEKQDETKGFIIADASEAEKYSFVTTVTFGHDGSDTKNYTITGTEDANKTFELYGVPEEYRKIILRINKGLLPKTFFASEFFRGFEFHIENPNAKTIKASSKELFVRTKTRIQTPNDIKSYKDVISFIKELKALGLLESYLNAINGLFYKEREENLSDDMKMRISGL